VQDAYQAAISERERRSLALDFERAVRSVREGRAEAGGECLQGITAPGTPAGFFTENLRHQKGPAAGEPFVLEPWQRRGGEGLVSEKS